MRHSREHKNPTIVAANRGARMSSTNLLGVPHILLFAGAGQSNFPHGVSKDLLPHPLMTSDEKHGVLAVHHEELIWS
jgi:hypothetical protein